jgi:hypothetical protein
VTTHYNNLNELGPDSNNKLYGLLDTQDNFFYKVYFEQAIIEHLQTLIQDRRPTVVIPLHKCSNWHRNIVDNTNCSHWGLDVFSSEYRSASLTYKNINLIQNYHVVDCTTQILFDNLSFVTNLLTFKLPVDNIRFQMPEKLQIMFNDDPWVQKAILKEKHYLDQYTVLYDDIVEEIKKFTQEINIDQTDYVDQLEQKIKAQLIQCDQSFFKWGNYLWLR